MNDVRLSDKILPAFRNAWHAVKHAEHLYYVFKGGRNSSKSTHISIMIVVDMMKNPINALCLRKVGQTLQESVYEQLLWAIDYLGVRHLWKVNKSPLKLTYLPRGNYILFRGADDPAKIKSIKTSRYPIAIMWVEELAEFLTEEDISTIVNSVVRAELPGDLRYKIFFSYNPPKRKQSWVNKKFESHFVPDNTYIHHSTYHENPHTSEAFKQEAAHVQKKNPMRYEWEFEGKPIGSGIIPFTNLTFRDISDDEIATFDNIRQGVDWGYGADPFAFVRWHYDKTRRRLYAMDEIYGVKLSNRAVADILKERGYAALMSTADSAEPKSIDEMKDLGVKMKGAKKGQGSVEYGEKWLDDLDEIIIDPHRTPNTAKEFEDIDYQTDRDGNLKNRLEDAANHAIDATRYACEDDMNNAAPGAWVDWLTAQAEELGEDERGGGHGDAD
ncbi:PBSX family phage terminase large subunit [Alicyclobacillus sp. ALC3]|uniref:PBSX family phage terminase large subunit n=1 Tax=Alicyclobacillus sp. ALC3 TaxID=2796143 RepID=UPI002379211A|nr:PBSX family phage terminase large subunit [Alicyclobacillus sp. ALC3]WDL97811.1 PBSX family phage terminase large subunit [Alicyclobacillus sp. ALC3]